MAEDSGFHRAQRRATCEHDNEVGKLRTEISQLSKFIEERLRPSVQDLSGLPPSLREIIMNPGTVPAEKETVVPKSASLNSDADFEEVVSLLPVNQRLVSHRPSLPLGAPAKMETGREAPGTADATAEHPFEVYTSLQSSGPSVSASSHKATTRTSRYSGSTAGESHADFEERNWHGERKTSLFSSATNVTSLCTASTVLGKNCKNCGHDFKNDELTICGKCGAMRQYVPDMASVSLNVAYRDTCEIHSFWGSACIMKSSSMTASQSLSWHRTKMIHASGIAARFVIRPTSLNSVFLGFVRNLPPLL
jgi:hypothetical protein